MFLYHIIRCLGILPDFNGFWVGLSATSSQLTAALSAPPSSFQRPVAANDTTALRWTDNSAASGGPGASVLQVRIFHPSSLCIPPASNQTCGVFKESLSVGILILKTFSTLPLVVQSSWGFTVDDNPSEVPTGFGNRALCIQLSNSTSLQSPGLVVAGDCSWKLPFVCKSESS